MLVNMGSKIVCVVLCALIGLSAARSGLYSEESPSPVRIEQCRQHCITKVSLNVPFVSDHPHISNKIEF